ncbi:MAG TPA: DUF4229 domain-containing protein [Streptomyces sp.]|jgi:hypothetical protein|nr:DUF4229 domain-containing protein [Streptomyces sp.]
MERNAVSRSSHATLRYTALRLGIFAGCFLVVAILAYVGVIPEGIGRSNPLWILLLALVVSAPISYVVLRRQRDDMSEQIVDGVTRAKQKVAANQSQEDAAVDADAQSTSA